MKSTVVLFLSNCFNLIALIILTCTGLICQSLPITKAKYEINNERHEKLIRGKLFRKNDEALVYAPNLNYKTNLSHMSEVEVAKNVFKKSLGLI